MTEMISTKPYMLRAIHEWCVDNNLTPHLIVVVNRQTRVPMAYVKDGEIVLNVNYGATKDLHIDNESVVFSARFGGVSQNIYIPMNAVKGIFARENGQGMFFEVSADQNDVDNAEKTSSEAGNSSIEVDKKRNFKKPSLTIVK
ncbi:MAG: ClpXP protease specificity-enhancing factor [Methylotenera sp.]|nr:ClpXP protease specificity-enhancing factor [Methylotenera sp.]MDD4926571.1 ClpXP protease specificity-enhancing factor [Methylotenera sp.]NOS95193.1 ClpXP protease specificity-enhancing factor [Methylotenera sp.]NOU41117.1 ClpXP protease specificity-enhancing factor [Methylotenera sp.]